jgi:hypothetical protein
MGEIADQMDGTRRAFDEAAKRGVTRRMDAGRDEIQQPASQDACRLQLATLNAADGRLSYPKQFGRVRLFHAAELANKPQRHRERARVLSTDIGHGASIRLAPPSFNEPPFDKLPLPEVCKNQHRARPAVQAVDDRGGRAGLEKIRGQMPEGAGHRNKGVPGNEGVGEHVRTRFHAGPWPDEIADS